MTALVSISEAKLLKRKATGPLPLAWFVKEAPRTFREMEARVRQSWAYLSEEEREAIVGLAYALIEPPRGFLARLKALPVSIQLGWAAARGEITLQDMAEFYTSAMDFARAVLNRLEEEDQALRQKVQEALEKALSQGSRPLTDKAIDAAILGD